MELLYVAALVFSMLTCGHGQKTMNVENTTYVEIMASGTKMMASKQMNISADQNALTVELKGLKEMKNATEMGRVLNLTDITITLGDPTDVAAADGVIESRQIIVTSGATHVLGGTLTLTFDIFKAAGTITRGDENANVTKGDVKISAKLVDYAFPDDVEMLMLSLDISGSDANPTMVADAMELGGDVYALGGDGLVALTKKAMIVADYVDVDPSMDKTMMTVSFNKATPSSPIEYSILLRPAKVSTGGGGNPSSSTRIASLGFYLWFLLLAHRALW